MTVSYEVRLPVHLRGRTPFEVRFHSRSAQWADLHLVPSGSPTRPIVTVPKTLAHHTFAVPDKVSYVWKDGALSPLTRNNEARPGCLYLAAESPHKHEFDETGKPLGPLRNPQTRGKLEKHLPRLIMDAERQLGRTFNDVDVVLGNPIQFQASLHCLMKDQDARLKTCVRDKVWRALFARAPIRKDFERRLAQYRPGLLILAPTHKVRADLVGFAAKLSIPYVVVSKHPCVWSEATTLASPPTERKGQDIEADQRAGRSVRNRRHAAS